MRRRLALLCLLAAARPAGAQDPMTQALSDEMKRTTDQLEMGSLGRPYFVSYSVDDSTSVYLWSALGASRDPRVSRSRLLKVGVRVGGPEFDNTLYVAKDFWNYRPPIERMVWEDDYDALRFAAWSLSDETYKAALQTFSQKRAYQKVRMIKEESPDLSSEPVLSIREEAPETSFEQTLWQERLRDLSAKFRGYPGVQRSGLGLSWIKRRVFFMDSEGRASLKPANEAHITIEAATQAEDGMELADRRRIIRNRPEDLPAPAELEAEVTRLADDITALSTAPTMDAYIGPVLLEGQAAGEFFNQLLVRNVSAPRPLWIEEESLKDRFRAGELAGRLGLRVLSPFLDVVDDPTLKEFEGTPLVGHYPFDDQGIPAQKVQLVQKGILKDLLMSRSPTKERRRSNGHGRSSLFEFPSGRPGNIIISADKTLSERALKAELLKEARDFGLSYGLIVRRIAEEDFQEEGEPLSAPVLVFKAHVNGGKEELMRNAQFSGVTLRALRDIVAASDKRHVYNYYQLGPYRQNRGELPASIVHPSILVSEMELKKSERKPEKLPYLRSPVSEP